MIRSRKKISLTRVSILILFLLLGSVIALSQELPEDGKFSHRLHVVDNEVDCGECHPSITGSEAIGESNFPTTNECEACHEGVRELSVYGIKGKDRPPAQHPAPIYQLIKFNHKLHLGQGLSCLTCHTTVKSGSDSTVTYRPSMVTCMNCHSAHDRIDRCDVCHNKAVTLSDIHPGDWRHLHGSSGTSEKAWCNSCHKSESTCIECHRGDNVTQSSHPPNYQYTHGLDAKSKKMDCLQCHDSRYFCQSCHEENNRMPLNHSRASWRTQHGSIAAVDVEDCASCHDVADPTCGRSGCHSDRDGVKGTNPRIHGEGGLLDSHGPWHSDDGYFCYSCHTNNRQSGIAFCGYCHRRED